MLYNGLGRHDAARDAAREAFQHDLVGHGPLLVPELAEAASRTGDTALLELRCGVALGARVVSSDWVLGIEARVGALLSEGEAAERLYRDSMVHLSGNRVRLDLARTHLLYGEWLRRASAPAASTPENNSGPRSRCSPAWAPMPSPRGPNASSGDGRARPQTHGRDPRRAHSSGGADRDFASEGLSNSDIGARLFISQHTVAYHLRKMFSKLGITSRDQLGRVVREGGVRQAT